MHIYTYICIYERERERERQRDRERDRERVVEKTSLADGDEQQLNVKSCYYKQAKHVLTYMTCSHDDVTSAAARGRLLAVMLRCQHRQTSPLLV